MRYVQLDPLSTEDALGRLTAALRQAVTARTPVSADGSVYVSIDTVVHAVQQEQDDARRASEASRRGASVTQYDSLSNAAGFYDAAWQLCTRGILRPTMVPPGATATPGTLFSITAYGREWVAATDDHDTLPTDAGRFGALLSARTERFGSAYHVRSQEALRCHRAHTYLACCVMCGAAAESITLALATAKAGDADLVMREYLTGSGRSKIEKRLVGQATDGVRRELTTYLSLLRYWRDDAAHGAASDIGEGDAFAALLLLLRFAQFADDRWGTLTARSA